MIDWPKVAKKVNSLYSSPEGRPAYPLVTMVKIIVLQQWYNASDAGTLKRSYGYWRTPYMGLEKNAAEAGWTGRIGHWSGAKLANRAKR